MAMQVKDVTFGSTKVQFEQGGTAFVRVNIARARFGHAPGETVFLNLNNGRLRRVSKDATVYAA